MSGGEQMFALWNATVDIFLCAFFGFFLWRGVTVDSNTFLFWVPFLALILFFRFRQMRTRWKL